MSRAESLWLIKSSGRVLGPYSTTRIAELLKTREVSVLDEVSPPLKRWQTIQYHDEFRDIVDSLRKASLSERTEATWTPTSQTGLTQTLTDLGNAELTEEITNNLDGFTNTSKEIVVHDVLEQVASTPGKTGRFQPQQMGASPAVQRQVEKTTRGLWLLTAFILLAAAAFIVHKRWASGGLELRPSMANLKQNIISQVQIGHYAEALKEMKNYFSDPMQAGDLAIYYGSLLIQVEGQTVIGRRLLNTVLASPRPEIKQAYAGLGLADLIDGQLDAAENHFLQALQIDAEYIPAETNLASVALQRGEYAKSKQLALKALRHSPFQGEALITLAEAQLYLFKTNGNLQELGQVRKMLNDFRAKQWDYAAEVGFYALYYDFLNRDHSLEDRLQAYLDLDPRLTQDHRHNVFIYKGRTQWKVLARFCEQMSEQMEDSARISALKASCYAHEQRWDAARTAIEKAVHQSPKDALIHAWYSYVLRESGDADQAGVVLGRAMEFDRRGLYNLPTLLQARFYQSAGLVDGARDHWQRLYERKPDDLVAVTGMAWVSLQNKVTDEATKYLNLGLHLSPDYIPLLEIRQKGEADGWYVAN